MCYKNKKTIMIDFQENDFEADDKQDNVSLKIVSSQEWILASTFSCFSQKVSSQLQPALEEMNVEEPTDQDLSPGGIPSLWSSPERGTALIMVLNMSIHFRSGAHC